jgi:molecular chaperone GrpE
MTTSDHDHHPAPEAPEPETTASQAQAGAPAEPLVSRIADTDADAGADAETDADAAAAVGAEAGVPAAPDDPQALAEKAARADEYLALAQRRQAEFENFRKRATRDAASAQERGAAKLATALLPAIDNLERALTHAPQDADEHGFVTGVRHVHSDLIAALQKSGIEQFSPEGEAFDPNQHEALAQQPTEGAQPGTVVEVYQRGYRAGETVVRPARVVVAG